MSQKLTLTLISGYLQSDHWKILFTESDLSYGDRLARSKRIQKCSAAFLSDQEVEIVSYVSEKSGDFYETSIVLWLENDKINIESSCSCPMQNNCMHCVATIEYLKRGERLAVAFGEKPNLETINCLKKFNTGNTATSDPESKSPHFLLKVNRDESNHFGMPIVYANAFVIYSQKKLPLEPSGNAHTFIIEKQKYTRDQIAETAALQTLYSLDLIPFDLSEATHKNSKIAYLSNGIRYDREENENCGKSWAPDKKKWPYPELYWQKFRHEAVQLLKDRHWEIQFSSNVGLNPLIFQSSSWKAEIVEEGKGWFNISAGFEINNEYFEIQPILAALVANNFLARTENVAKDDEFMIFLPDGRGLVLPVGRFRHILVILGELLEYKFTSGPIKMSPLDSAVLANDTDIELIVPSNIKQLAEQIRSIERIEAVAVPANLNATLRDYQLHGFYWMQFLAKNRLCGILADDMGLGKTLQTLAHIITEIVSGRSRKLPHLVIAPTSVVNNWQREAAKFAPSLKVLVLQGPNRHNQYKRSPDCDVIITSYALLQRDLEYHIKQHYHLIVLDEAQYIKNPTTQASMAVRELKSNHRLCLSGTPIENNLAELWSLFAFLMPGLLGQRSEFKDKYLTPIEKQNDISIRDILKRKVAPLILRRTKNDVAKELPPKTEILHTIKLCNEQKDLYETVRSSMDKQVRQAIASRGGEAKMVFLDALLKLRQICCHPSLLNFQLENKLIPECKESSKMIYLIELLSTLRKEGHRVLIFSQFTSILSIIENFLISKNINYLLLTGATKDRQSLVERFQDGDGDVFLISLKAGGTGLTLTGADTVIHYDPWWNPAIENQATDRAYRIGQDKPVMVHKLICEGTVEQRMQSMQIKKGKLAESILDTTIKTFDINEDTITELFG